jgi:hypothetical protein
LIDAMEVGVPRQRPSLEKVIDGGRASPHLSGDSLAAGTPEELSDIDLILVTEAGTLDGAWA